jgi:hypothetical protein
VLTDPEFLDLGSYAAFTALGEDAEICPPHGRHFMRTAAQDHRDMRHLTNDSTFKNGHQRGWNVGKLVNPVQPPPVLSQEIDPLGKHLSIELTQGLFGDLKAADDLDLLQKLGILSHRVVTTFQLTIDVV